MSRICHVDKIAIGEISVNFLGATHAMTAKAKLVSTKNGASYGSMTMQHWSPDILAKLAELRAAMEEEIEEVFFDEGRTTTSRVGVREEGGLGEHLNGDDLAPPA